MGKTKDLLLNIWKVLRMFGVLSVDYCVRDYTRQKFVVIEKDLVH